MAWPPSVPGQVPAMGAGSAVGVEDVLNKGATNNVRLLAYAAAEKQQLAKPYSREGGETLRGVHKLANTKLHIWRTKRRCPIALGWPFIHRATTHW